MNNERVTPKNAAKELQMDVITLRELMKREKLPIGYAIKREGKSKWGFYIYGEVAERYTRQLCTIRHVRGVDGNILQLGACFIDGSNPSLSIQGDGANVLTNQEDAPIT